MSISLISNEEQESIQFAAKKIKGLRSPVGNTNYTVGFSTGKIMDGSSTTCDRLVAKRISR